MKNFKQRISVVVIGLLNALTTVTDVKAQLSLEAYSQLANNRAQLITARATMLTAQATMLTAQVSAQTSLATAQATMLTAQANANKTNVETLQGLVQAQALELTNKQKKVEAFYARRALHDDYQELAKSRSRFAEKNSASSSKRQQPQRLDRKRLEDEVYWPLLLRRPEFSNYRLRISQLLVKSQASNNGINKAVSEEMKTIASQMRAEILPLISQTPVSEYVAARKFINSLVFEARFPSVIEGLASNR